MSACFVAAFGLGTYAAYRRPAETSVASHDLAAAARLYADTHRTIDAQHLPH
ncbi:MAG: hypothetical protein WAV45_12515 [Propionibacteriaceae bacterium]|nr:hypothetical protein [Micropruina sp.]